MESYRWERTDVSWEALRNESILMTGAYIVHHQRGSHPTLELGTLQALGPLVTQVKHMQQADSVQKCRYFCRSPHVTTARHPVQMHTADRSILMSGNFILITTVPTASLKFPSVTDSTKQRIRCIRNLKRHRPTRTSSRLQVELMTPDYPKMTKTTSTIERF